MMGAVAGDRQARARAVPRRQGVGDAARVVGHVVERRTLRRGVHAGAHCKPDTAAGYRSVLEGHILPALGEVGWAKGATWLPAIAAIRLLLLTGCWRGEILNLRWEIYG